MTSFDSKIIRRRGSFGHSRRMANDRLGELAYWENKLKVTTLERDLAKANVERALLELETLQRSQYHKVTVYRRSNSTSGKTGKNPPLTEKSLALDCKMAEALYQYKWVSRAAILQILQAKFPPGDLHILYDEIQHPQQPAVSRIKHEKAVWTECFGVFTAITNHFHGDEDSKLHEAMNAFNDKIMAIAKSKANVWEAVYDSAIASHTKTNKVGRVTDAIFWDKITQEVDAHCAPNPAEDPQAREQLVWIS
ncbi:MAG: hypothetical protein MMC33_008603 [Icmadophila ericetorum]|nr:hypothetical protein [Icmadophila ericetorum]